MCCMISSVDLNLHIKYYFVRVCLYVLCGHLLGNGWPLGSRLWCLTVSLSLSHWYPGSGVVLDCIDSWSLHPYLLCGDLNGTLLPTRNNKHDVVLKDFVKEHSLSTRSFDCVEPTFFHFNGVVTTGGKHRNYHEIVLTLFCSQATSGTHRGSVQAENWIKKRWCNFIFVLFYN